MSPPLILKNPIVMLHTVAWVGVGAYYGLEPFARVVGVERVYESLTFGLALYLFWGVTAVASLPVFWVSFRRALRSRDRGLTAQSGVGALLACSVLHFAAFLLFLIVRSPR